MAGNPSLYKKLLEMGIMPEEMQAAVARIKKEQKNDGRAPSLPEIIKFLESYLQWREYDSRVQAGEIIMVPVLTEKGKKIEKMFKGLKS